MASKNGGGSTTPKARTRIEEGVREYVDVGTATDTITPSEADEEPVAGPSSKAATVSTQDEPPAYTRVPDKISESEVLMHAHPKNQEMGEDVDEDYESLVDSLGMRCTVFEAEMKKRARVERRAINSELMHAWYR